MLKYVDTGEVFLQYLVYSRRSENHEKNHQSLPRTYNLGCRSIKACKIDYLKLDTEIGKWRCNLHGMKSTSAQCTVFQIISTSNCFCVPACLVFMLFTTLNGALSIYTSFN